MQQLELVSLLEKRKLIRNTAIRYVGKYIGDYPENIWGITRVTLPWLDKFGCKPLDSKHFWKSETLCLDSSELIPIMQMVLIYFRQHIREEKRGSQTPEGEMRDKKLLWWHCHTCHGGSEYNAVHCSAKSHIEVDGALVRWEGFLFWLE